MSCRCLFSCVLAVVIALPAFADEVLGKPTTLQDKLSYCYGVQVGDALKGATIDLKIFENGLRAALKGSKADLSTDQMEALLAASAKAKRESRDLVYQGYAREQLDTAAKELSYAKGYKMGYNLKEQKLTVSIPFFMSAVQAKLEGKELLLTSDEQFAAMNENAAALRAAANK